MIYSSSSRTLLTGIVCTPFVGPSEWSICDDVIYVLQSAYREVTATVVVLNSFHDIYCTK
jgi:hypothetical protein